MVKVFLVYKTDAWHNYKSRELIGVCTTYESVISIMTEYAKEEDEEPFDRDCIIVDQTQGYSGDGEFQWEPVEVDERIG